MNDAEQGAAILGPNTWLVDDMWERFQADPNSVSATWRQFFEGYRPPGGKALAHRISPEPVSPEPPTGPEPHPPASHEPDRSTPIKGVGARIVDNMERSLAVPTASSYRQVAAKLLEVNRSVINGYLGRTRGGKVSFTHIIGYAVVRTIADHMPQLNYSFATDEQGVPQLVKPSAVNLGLAIDLERRDGTRSLVVPAIRSADQLEFADFVAAYDELVRKANTGRLSPDDFSGVTVTLTNPGTLGTERSVPRLMPGQGLIVGVGALGYPSEFSAADPHTIADLGISKVLTLSSTYDHRIIQGAESGLFLSKVNDALLGEDDFYPEIFRSVGVPYTAVQWRRDANPHRNDDPMLAKQMQVSALINMYRVRGHLIADLDPLAAKPPQMHTELDPATYGLTIWDLDREFLTGLTEGVYAPVGGVERMRLGDILHVLRDAYCRTTGIEYTHIQSTEEKRWIQEHVEGVPSALTPEDKRHILHRLNAAEALEKFLGTKWMGQKRFGLEGAESAIPILDAVLEDAANLGMHSAVIGMAHRGRLNVLVNIVGKHYEQLFREFEGYVEPDSVQGSGDVKYHLGQEGEFRSRDGNAIHVELAANPSHLEAVNPVVEGMARAVMDQIEYSGAAEPLRYPVLPILLHGDAAFAGQGVVAETLNLSLIKGYRVGGTVHLVVNNQVGFTTDPSSARSSEQCTDIAKIVQAPIFHVNGDDPEACVRVAHLAFAYRQRFNKDVVIDMVCYRRHGHNEGDDPSYTQPLMYRAIDRRRSVRMLYTEALVRRGDISLEEAERALEQFNSTLQRALDATRESIPDTPAEAHAPAQPRGVLPHVETGVNREVLDHVMSAMDEVPPGFVVHPKLVKQFKARSEAFQTGSVDWATAEALAFGTLLTEGTSVRLAGQDSRRGTFSQRHSTLVCYQTGRDHLVLSSLQDKGTKLWIYDSLLSEYAALGFEYGYSVANPDALVIWEAQFGDFMNGAQIIIDQFIVAAEDKWKQCSGLVMLLPHGFEGQGPEHSSSRIERFLSLAADDNIQVVNPTTAAQYFHVLRRQMHREVRKPLVIFTPKSGLRAKTYRSELEALTSGHFQELLVDLGPDPATADRIVLTSGKIGHDALAHRDHHGHNVTVARVEQLFPWPEDAIRELIESHPSCTDIVWLQEEPENMGPWDGVKGRLYEACGETHEIHRVSRFASGSPATGKAAIHAQEQSEILCAAFDPFPSRQYRSPSTRDK